MSAITSEASHASTNRAIAARVEPLLDRPLRILDLGCGSGAFCRQLAGLYRARGWDPAEHLLGIDIVETKFDGAGVPFRRVDLNHTLPFEDGSFDVVVSIEVLEHVHAPYVLMEELKRILRPGGTLVFSVPNVANVLSRFGFLADGHYLLYPTPSIDPANAGRLCGHIQPLPVQYWHYGLRRVGFRDIVIGVDRRKRGALGLAVPLWPLFALAGRLRRTKTVEYDADLAIEVADVLPAVNSLDLLAGRCLVFTARRP